MRELPHFPGRRRPAAPEPAPAAEPAPTAPAGPPGAPPVRIGRRPLVMAALTLAVLAVAVALWSRRRPDPPPEFPVPPVSPSKFLNTRADARYVGSDACTECHRGRTESFRATGMGRSMAPVRPADEPPDATFDHPGSKHRYEVLRKDGRLWHRELLLTAENGEVLLSEYPLEYAVGSGHHSRTYLVDADGFLVESPVTWYASRGAWDMSPGYDRPDHAGFERTVSEACLSCHAGRVEFAGRGFRNAVVREAAIGCERCHGPGSLHVDRHANLRDPGADAGGGVDYTIVNPEHLPRELAEAVCQQCHLASAAVVVGRGRAIGDFRPGLPLQDFRQDYRLEVGGAPMTVVGHVEQMHLSACYTRSKTLTCATCHDPHGFPAPEQRVEYYRSVCLSCHQPDSCTVEPARRLRESPANDCVRCHMPTSKTDIPHLAFTHHRIGLHDRDDGGGHEPPQDGVLTPFFDYPNLTDLDKKRSLGLAYLEFGRNRTDPDRAAFYKEKALGILNGVHAAGLPDPALQANLARLRFDFHRGEVRPLLDLALLHPDIAAQDRGNALFLLAQQHHEQGRPGEAVAALQELVTLRRHSPDWLLLADCQEQLGRKAAAVASLENAVRISPQLQHIHAVLAQYYARQGDSRRARFHQERLAP